jgi:hypothetical protein
MDGQLALKPSEGPFLVATNILLFENLGLPLTRDDKDSIVEGDLDIFAPNSREIDQNRHGVGNLKHIQIGAETRVEIRPAGNQALQIAAKEWGKRRSVAEGGTRGGHKFHFRY